MRSRSLPRIAIPVACTADWNEMRAIEPTGARACAAPATSPSTTPGR